MRPVVQAGNSASCLWCVDRAAGALQRCLLLQSPHSLATLPRYTRTTGTTRRRRLAGESRAAKGYPAQARGSHRPFTVGGGAHLQVDAFTGFVSCLRPLHWKLQTSPKCPSRCISGMAHSRKSQRCVRTHYQSIASKFSLHTFIRVEADLV